MSTVADGNPLAPTQYGVASPLGYSAPVNEGEGISFADALRIIRQRKISIAVLFVFLMGASVAGTYLVQKYAPAYPSEAYFEVLPPKGQELIGEDRFLAPEMMKQIIATEANKLRQLSLLLRVVEQPEIKATRYYEWYESDAGKAARGMKDDLSVGQQGDTYFIRVGIATRYAKESRLIIEKLVEQHSKEYRAAGQDEKRDQINALQNERDQLEAELIEKRRALENFQIQTGIPTQNEQRVERERFIQDLKREITDIESQVAVAQKEFDSVRDMPASLLPLDARHKLMIDADPILRYYQSQIESIDIELRAALNIVGPGHRSIRVIRERQAGFRDKAVARREEMISKVRESQYESLQQGLALARAELLQRQNQLVQAQAEQRNLEANAQRLSQMQSEISRLEEQLRQVDNALRQSQALARDPTRDRLVLRQMPELALSPSRPSWPLYMVGGFIFAAAVAFGQAFLREFMDTGVRTPIDVARYGQLSVLGSVPLLDDEEATDVEEIEEAVLKAPRSLVAEAFRKIRTNLQYAGALETQRTILVTSPRPEDGKTSIAINLAATLANAGQRVLLIDCNFRRPGIRPQFPSSRADGLSNVLVGYAKLADVVAPTEQQNLSIMTTGRMPPTPAELLGSAAMRAMLKEALESFDRVIMDGPPALLISDATVLAAEVDGVILVTRSDRNRRGEIRRARDMLVNMGAHVFGAILNGVRARAGGYFRQQYREFYDYMSDETVVGELPPPDEQEQRDDEGTA